MASSLLKYCQFIEDTQGHQMELRYLRDTDKRELDFVILKDGKPELAIEAKLKDESLYYFQERIEIPKMGKIVIKMN